MVLRGTESLDSDTARDLGESYLAIARFFTRTLPYADWRVRVLPLQRHAPLSIGHGVQGLSPFSREIGKSGATNALAVPRKRWRGIPRNDCGVDSSARRTRNYRTNR